MNRICVKGLHTLCTCVVDYLGTRVVAQSIIPGILQGDSASSLVYGSIDNGESIASGHDIHELMKEASKKLFVAEREVKPLGVGGFKPKPEETEKPADVSSSSKTQQIGIASNSPPPLASTKEPVNICGPVECKGIVGSDKRHYVLDLIRLTPRDANWYEPEEEKRAIEAMKVAALAEATRMKSGDVVAQWGGLVASTTPDPLIVREGFTCVLRPELLHLYAVRKVATLQASKREEERLIESEASKQNGEETTTTADSKAAGAAAAAAEGSTAKDTETGGGQSEEVKEHAAVDPIAEVDETMLLRLNCNVFMPYACCTDANVARDDEQEVRLIAEYLRDKVIPGFVDDVQNGSINFVDGAALTKSMHSFGINNRYIGEIAKLSAKKLEALRAQFKNVVSLAANEAHNSEDIANLSYSVFYLEHLLYTCEVEMLARAVKRIIVQDVGRDSSVQSAPAPYLAYILNKVLGYSPTIETASGIVTSHSTQKSKKNKKKKAKGQNQSSAKNPPTPSASVGDQLHATFEEMMHPPIPSEVITRDFWTELCTYVSKRFRYSVTPESDECRSSIFAALASHNFPEYVQKQFENRLQMVGKDHYHKNGVENILGEFKPSAARLLIPLLRRICLKCGIQIAARKLNFDSVCQPLEENGAYGVASSGPISAMDIINIVPVVKHCQPQIPYVDAHHLLETGRFHLTRGHVQRAYDLIQEAAVLSYQVSGTSHKETAVTCSTLAMVLYHAGDPGGAVLQQQKALALYSHLQGHDHPETAHGFGNLAVYLQGAQHTKMGIHFVKHCIYVLQQAGGPWVHDVSTMYHKLAAMYFDANEPDAAIKALKEVLVRCSNHSALVVHAQHLLALCYHKKGLYRDALNFEKLVYNYYKNNLGEEHERSKDAFTLMEKFTTMAVKQSKGIALLKTKPQEAKTERKEQKQAA
jgi:hypothetical protein